MTTDTPPVIVAPTVTTSAATGVTDNDAVLHGNLTDGGESCNVTWYWDTTDWGASENWSNSVNQTGQVTGGISYNITGSLSASTLYCFIVKAINSAGTDWGATANFTTTAISTAIYAPTNFTLTDLGAITIGMTWDMGAGANYTMIRVSRTGYPTNVTDGELAYYGPDSTANTSGYDLTINNFFFVPGGMQPIMLPIRLIMPVPRLGRAV